MCLGASVLGNLGCFDGFMGALMILLSPVGLLVVRSFGSTHVCVNNAREGGQLALLSQFPKVKVLIQRNLPNPYLK